MDYKRLLDVDQAAEMLSVHPATLYRWARQRKVSCVRLGQRVIRFDPSAIEKYIKQHSIDATILH